MGVSVSVQDRKIFRTVIRWQYENSTVCVATQELSSTIMLAAFIAGCIEGLFSTKQANHTVHYYRH